MKKPFDLHVAKKFLTSQSDVAFAYLFGSAMHGFFNRESDVDIAVYLKGDKSRFFERRLELSEALSPLLKKEANVVVFNQIDSLFFKFVILKEGKLLCDNDHGTRLDFEVREMNLYYDYAPFIEEYNRCYLEKNI